MPHTSVLEQCGADSSQQRKSDEISQTGCYRCGHIIRVDAHLPGANDHTNHYQTWTRMKAADSVTDRIMLHFNIKRKILFVFDCVALSRKVLLFRMQMLLLSSMNQSIRTTSKGLCDTEDWSNDCYSFGFSLCRTVLMEMWWEFMHCV